MELTDKELVVCAGKLTISTLAKNMLEVMGVRAQENPREYGVYENVVLQPYHATFLAYRHESNGGPGRLASKAEVFRSNENLESWCTWDNMVDKPVLLVHVQDPNKAQKGKRRKA